MAPAACASTPALCAKSATRPRATITIIVTVESSPSTPSMRLTELVVATMVNTAKGMYQMPRSHWMSVKGT